MPPPATNTEPTTPFPERAFSAHICNTPVKAKFWLKVLGYDYQGVIQCYTITNNLIRKTMVLVPYDQLSYAMSEKTLWQWT
jgi:hypothetical protein